MLSLLKISGHCLKALFEVITVEPRSLPCSHSSLFASIQGGDGNGDCIAQRIQASVDVETAHPDSEGQD